MRTATMSIGANTSVRVVPASRLSRTRAGARTRAIWRGLLMMTLSAYSDWLR